MNTGLASALQRSSITAAILLALLLGPFFVVTSALHIGPFAKRPLPYPAVLLPSSGAYFGAYAPPRKTEDPMGGIRRLESQIGRQLAIDHEYYLWNEPIPTPRQTWDASSGRLPFIDWNARNTDGSAVPWSQIANGSQDAMDHPAGQRLQSVRVRRSTSRSTTSPKTISATWGTPADYAAAFRHVVDIFRSQGVSNVAFVWDMMNWTFDQRSGRDPNAYYPGDGYVDIIGVDGYNTYPGKAGTSWESFQQIFQPANDFAFNHNKPWMAVETGTEEDPQQPGRKGQWFRDVDRDGQELAPAEGVHLLRHDQGAGGLERRQLGIIRRRLRRPGSRSLHERHPGRHRSDGAGPPERPRPRTPRGAGSGAHGRGRRPLQSGDHDRRFFDHVRRHPRAWAVRRQTRRDLRRERVLPMDRPAFDLVRAPRRVDRPSTADRPPADPRVIEPGIPVCTRPHARTDPSSGTTTATTPSSQRRNRSRCAAGFGSSGRSITSTAK